MREYFASLNQSAHPKSSDPRAWAITCFQELLLISFCKFSIITDDMIFSEQKCFRNEIIHNIESFSKCASVWNLKSLGRFTKEQVGLVYDVLYKAMCISPPPPAAVPPLLLFTTNNGHEEKAETRIGLKTFRQFLSEIATWARDEKIVLNGLTRHVHREVMEHEFIDWLYYCWDTSCRGALLFQNLMSGLDGVIFNDLMENIEWFFNLHDKDKDGYLAKDEVLMLSESLLFIFWSEIGDVYLGAVSRFMSNAFEYGDALLPQGEDGNEIEPNQAYLNLTTYVFQNIYEILEAFFETDLVASFWLHPLPELKLPVANASLLGDIWSTIATDSNKKIFNMFMDEIGKMIGKHQVIHRPSIGRITMLQEPKVRELLLMRPSMRHLASKLMLKESMGSPTSAISSSMSTLSIDMQDTVVGSGTGKEEGEMGEKASSLSSPPMLMIQAVNAALMERMPFAIDDAKEDNDDDDDFDEDVGDDGVMDEVDVFLEENDSGLRRKTRRWQMIFYMQNLSSNSL